MRHIYYFNVIFFVMSICDVCAGQEMIWTGQASSYWSNPNNWSPGIPGASDSARIERPISPWFNSANVILDTDAEVLGLRIAENREGGLATLAQPAQTTMSAGSLFLGGAGGGRYTQGGGSAYFGNVTLGGENGRGAYQLATGGMFFASSNVNIGNYSSFEQTGGASFIGTEGNIGSVILDVAAGGSYLLAGDSASLKVYGSELLEANSTFSHLAGLHDIDGNFDLNIHYDLPNVGSLRVGHNLMVNTPNGSMHISLPNSIGNGVTIEGDFGVAGIVQHNTGIVHTDSMSVGGTYHLDDDGSLTVDNSMAILGSGSFWLEYENAVVSAGTLSNSGYLFQKGDLGGTTHSHNGIYEWRGGTTSVASLTVSSGGLLRIQDGQPDGDHPHLWDRTVVYNQGLTEWRAYAWPAATPIYLTKGSAFYNQSDGQPNSGVFAIYSDSEMLASDLPISGDDPVFVNRSLVVKYAGTGTTRFAIRFRNEGGIIDVRSGTIQFDSPMSIPQNQSLYKFGAGTLRFTGAQSHETGSALWAHEGTVNLESDAGGGGPTLTAHVTGNPDNTNAKIVLASDQSLKGLSVSFSDSGTQSFDLASPTTAGAFRSVKIYAGDQAALDAAKATLYDAMQNANFAGVPDPFDGIYDSGVSAHLNSAVGIAQQSDELGNFLLIRLTRRGDANLDGNVSIADWMILSSHYNLSDGSATWDIGDFNYDGNVTIADWNILSSNYNSSYSGSAQTLPPPGATPIPEPAIATTITGCCGLILANRRRGKPSRIA